MAWSLHDYCDINSHVNLGACSVQRVGAVGLCVMLCTRADAMSSMPRTVSSLRHDPGGLSDRIGYRL